MNYLNYAIYLTIIFSFFISENQSKKIAEDEEQLLFVYEHCRHGNRAPNDKKNGLYNKENKTDAYNVSWENPGVLTESGKLQHFFLGLRNKYKYSKFINIAKYNKSEIIFRSSGAKRCTESLYYQILGMYFKEPSQKSKDKYSIKFDQDIYNYSMPPNFNNWKNKKEFSQLNNKIKNFLKNKKIDGLNLTSFNTESKKKYNIKFIKNDFMFVSQRCKNHERYIKKQRKKYKEIIKSNFIDNYSQQLKKVVNYSNDFETYFYKRSIAKSYADHFISDYSNGRKELNIFSKKTGIDLEDYFQKCKNVYFFFMYNIYCYSKSCVLNASRFMKEILDYFENAINYNKNKNKTKKIKDNKINKNIKMIIDLGHDVTVNSFHVFMNKTFNIDYTYCVFGCNIYFELYKIKKNKYSVKYYENDLLRLNIDYNEFKKKVSKLIWKDSEIEDFCKGDKENIFNIHKEQYIIKKNNKKVNQKKSKTSKTVINKDKNKDNITKKNIIKKNKKKKIKYSSNDADL